MDYIFISETNVSSNTEPHEHEIKFFKDYGAQEEIGNRFIKDGKNFYIVFAGTPNITYLSDGSAEHEAELTRIKDYIDTLDGTHIDYDEFPNQLRVYYYSDEYANNAWISYDSQWQSDIVPCKIMQGTHNVAMSRFGTPEPGAYTIKYSRLVGSSIQHNSDSTKLVFIEGDEFTLNGVSKDRDTCELITGNVEISTSTTAYIAIIEDAV